MAIKRVEIVGHEGGVPPIHLEFWDDDECVGVYIRDSMKEPPKVWDPFFDKRC